MSNIKLSVVHCGRFKLDGGAMFGVVPQQMWKKMIQPDANNMCTWATRSLLLEVGDRKILVDTGIGNKQSEKFRSHFEPHGEENVLDSLKQVGTRAEEITDVFLTHLHFDHVGGALLKDSSDRIKLQFPNATYWSNQKQYDWAMTPNQRERNSFLKENFVPLKEQGKLQFIDVQREPVDWIENLKVEFVYGHTEAMMVLHIPFGESHLVYCADLLPSIHHIGLPYVMSYDIRPLKTLEEKESLLSRALDQKWKLFLEHDIDNECCTLKKNEKGRIVLDSSFNLQTIL